MSVRVTLTEQSSTRCKSSKQWAETTNTEQERERAVSTVAVNKEFEAILDELLTWQLPDRKNNRLVTLPTNSLQVIGLEGPVIITLSHVKSVIGHG